MLEGPNNTGSSIDNNDLQAQLRALEELEAQAQNDVADNETELSNAIATAHHDANIAELDANTAQQDAKTVEVETKIQEVFQEQVVESQANVDTAQTENQTQRNVLTQKELTHSEYVTQVNEYQSEMDTHSLVLRKQVVYEKKPDGNVHFRDFDPHNQAHAAALDNDEVGYEEADGNFHFADKVLQELGVAGKIFDDRQGKGGVEIDRKQLRQLSADQSIRMKQAFQQFIFFNNALIKLQNQNPQFASSADRQGVAYSALATNHVVTHVQPNDSNRQIGTTATRTMGATTAQANTLVYRAEATSQQWAMNMMNQGVVAQKAANRAYHDAKNQATEQRIEQAELKRAQLQEEVLNNEINTSLLKAAIANSSDLESAIVNMNQALGGATIASSVGNQPLQLQQDELALLHDEIQKLGPNAQGKQFVTILTYVINSLKERELEHGKPTQLVLFAEKLNKIVNFLS